jgi:tetratricopeptide (TPR) repeat protein
MKKPVPHEIVANISAQGKAGREAWQRGDIQKAEDMFLAAWRQLPEPKIEYDYAQSLSGGLVTFYRDTKQFEKAKEWLTVMRGAYGPGPDIYVEFLAATVYYDAGMLDDAFAIFDSAYKKFKQRPFQGEDKKYLQFYMERAGEEMLPLRVYDRVTSLSGEGNGLIERGDFRGAIAKWSEALTLIPEPKTDWEAATWLYASIADAHYQHASYSEARAACFDTLNCPGGTANPFVHYRLGQCEVRLGNHERAVSHLLQAYMLDGEEIFLAEKDGGEYLDILKSRGLIPRPRR